MNNALDFSFQSTTLTARSSGALWWADQRVLCVSDLHLGKSDRIARRTGAMLPPYETRETLDALAVEVEALNPATVICLGDSFDDLAAAEALIDSDRMLIARLQSGRRWVWIEGNHDPGPVEFGGDHLADLALGPLVFRHIATDQMGEVSGHYHPKVRLPVRGRIISRAAFLVDDVRVLVPAFGTYTGGLCTTSPALSGLMAPGAQAILTGTTVTQLPMPRG